jgi:hypothetical protein
MLDLRAKPATSDPLVNNSLQIPVAGAVIAEYLQQYLSAIWGMEHSDNRVYNKALALPLW